MSGIPRIVLDIAPQPHDEIVDGAGVSVLVQPPHLFEEIFARDNFAVVAHQVAQKFRFHQREMDRTSPSPEFEGPEIDRLAGKRKLLKVSDLMPITLRLA